MSLAVLSHKGGHVVQWPLQMRSGRIIAKESPLGGQRQEPWRKPCLAGSGTSAGSRSTYSPLRRMPLQHFAPEASIVIGK